MTFPATFGEKRDGPLLYRCRETGRIVAGIGVDLAGRWTWWARANGARRVRAESREAAIEAVEAVLGGGRA